MSRTFAAPRAPSGARKRRRIKASGEYDKSFLAGVSACRPGQTVPAAPRTRPGTDLAPDSGTPPRTPTPAPHPPGGPPALEGILVYMTSAGRPRAVVIG